MSEETLADIIRRGEQTENYATFSLRVPERMQADLTREAAELGVSRNALIVAFCSVGLRNLHAPFMRKTQVEDVQLPEEST